MELIEYSNPLEISQIYNEPHHQQEPLTLSIFSPPTGLIISIISTPIRIPIIAEVDEEPLRRVFLQSEDAIAIVLTEVLLKK